MKLKTITPTESEGLAAFGSEDGGDEPRGASVPPGGGPVFTPPDPPEPAIEEKKEESASPAARGSVFSTRRFRVLLALLVVVAGAAGAWEYQRRFAVVVPGKLEIRTTPAGLPVIIAGNAIGATPVAIDLAPGDYQVQVGTGKQQRELTVRMTAGGVVQQLIDLPVEPAAPAVVVGALNVHSDGGALTVVVDGVERGQTPLTIRDLSVGEHALVVRGERRTVRHTVTVSAGETVSLVIPAVEAAAAAPGFLSIVSPVVMQVRQNGELIGTTEAGRIMLPAGEHEIEIANDALGYKAVRKVTVPSAKVASISLDLPTAMLSINAEPWAEVWVDGERIGETPIANLPVRIGSHDVILRHPQLGERRESVLVGLRQPARLGVGMKR